MVHKLSLIKGFIGLVFILISMNSTAQQDPQYTHYMFNTLSVNPAYAGQRETLSVVGLHRSQWVGVDGAPITQSLSIHSPLRNERVGIRVKHCKRCTRTSGRNVCRC
jgi:type IX secretion system PorP/SprF family membrane protein